MKWKLVRIQRSGGSILVCHSYISLTASHSVPACSDGVISPVGAVGASSQVQVSSIYVQVWWCMQVVSANI